MPNIPAVAAYESGAREFLNSEFFTNQDSSSLGIAFNAFKTQFTQGNPGYFDDEDLKKIDSINKSLLTEYKNKAEIPRFIPKAEEWNTYYEPRPDFSLAKTAEEKIKMAKDWESASLKKASDLRPADAEDFRSHLEYITNNDIRQSAFDAKKSKEGFVAWADDKTNRMVEGGLSMVSPFIPGADRWLAESFPEDPSKDEDISSLLFAGVGQLASQAAIALGTSALAGPEAGVAAIGTIYSARAVIEGYKEEMRKSGNPDKALDVGLAGIPGALFETTADAMLVGLGKSGKVYLQAFKAATTREAKEAILKQALPSLGKEALKNGIQEATLGSVGADWTTGYGRYLASGDESYIPSAESLAKGALVEGILGAGYSAGNSAMFDASRTKAFAMELAEKNKAKSDDIFKALSGKNYQEAVEIAARDYPDEVAATKPEEKPKTAKAEGIQQPSEASKNISLSVIGSTNIAYLEQQKNAYKKSNDLESAKRIEESIKAIREGTFVTPDSFTIDSAQLLTNGFEESLDPIGLEDSYDVTLDNNKTIQSDDRYIFVKGLTNRDVATQNIAKGGVGIFINEGQASLVLGKNFKTSGKFQLSQSPKKGFSAIKINDAFANEQGQTVITSFSILGQVQESSKSEKSKQKVDELKARFASKSKDSSSTNEATSDDFNNSGINEALLIFDTVSQNESFSDAGFASIEESIDRTIDSLELYASKNTNEADAVLDMQNQLLAALEEAKSKTKPVEPVKPVRENVDLFRQTIANQEGEQLELNIPVKVSDLNGRKVNFDGKVGTLTIDGPLAYVDNVEVSGSDALIQDVQGLSQYTPPNTEYTLGPDKSGRMYKTETINGKLSRVYENGDVVPVTPANKNTTSENLKQKGQKIKKAVKDRKQKIAPVEKEVSSAVAPTPSNITSEPEAIFESVTDEGVVVETVVAPTSEPVSFDDEAKLLKEIERTKRLIADDPSYEVTLKEQEAQLALLRATGAPDVPTAIQEAINEPDNEIKNLVEEIVYKPETELVDLSSNKIISDKIDSHIATFENQKAKDLWNENKDLIQKYFQATLDAKGANVREGEFLKLKVPMLNWVDSVVAELDPQAKEKIQKDRSKTDKVTKEFLESERNERNANEKADRQLSAEYNKIKYSIGSEPSNTIDPKEANDYISKNHPGIDTVNTRKTTYDGHQWRGRTDFTSGTPRITINLSNIRDLAQLRNVIHEELAHIAYNDPGISTSLKKIVESTKLREELDGLYSSGDVFEESVVKRMADLVDSYTEKGMFNKLFTAIKSYVKDKLGMTLNDNDLSYISYRAIVRAGKVTRGSGLTKFAYDPQDWAIKAIERYFKNTESLLKEKLGIDISLSDRPIPKMKYSSTSLNPLKESYPEIANLIELGYLNKQSNSNLAKATNSTSLDIAGLEESKLEDFNPLELDLFKSFQDSAIKGEKRRLSILRDLETETKGLYSEQELLDIADEVYYNINSAYFANTNIKFNKVEPNKNTNTTSPLFEPEDDILSVVTGQISEEKKRTLRNIQRAVKKKLEKELVIDEPQAWNALKAVKWTFLNNDQLKSFNSLLDEFVRTRSKSKDPGAGVRTSTDSVIAQAAELAKASRQGQFDFLQLQHDFLEGKDFQADYNGDIDLVNQLAKDQRAMNDSDAPSDKDAGSLQAWQLRTLALQETAFENRDYLQDLINEQFPSANNITKNDIIAKRVGIYTETVDDVLAGHKEVAKQYVNSLMADPTEKSWRDLRKQYYGLMDFMSDGYLNVEDFVSEEMSTLLQGKISEESFVKAFNAPWRSRMHEGAASFYTNTRTMGTEVAELAHNLTKKFRAGILAAERLMADFIDPTLQEFMDKAVALNGGKPFDGQQLNLAGIYGRARQFKANESVTEGILKSKSSIEESIEKDTNSIWPGRKEAAQIHSKFTSDLYAGIDSNTPNEEALGILEENAKRLLPEGLIGYVKDVVELFEVTKPLSKFTSEFGLGRPFDEIINYIPSMAINKDGTPLKLDLVDITNTSDDMSVGHINQDTNMQKSGGSSTKIRKGFLPEGMVYAWNINHLAHNRMRLNLNDYLTLPQRRELNNVISGKGTKRKELANLLKDDGQQERVSRIQRTVLTMWRNAVQASNYVSEGHGLMNALSNIWASTKLASLYQLPGQIASNTIPYFVVHAGSPKRIKYLFDAYNIILKRRSGMPLDPRLEKTVDRVLSVISSRSQEQFLDKSIALDRTSSQTLEKLKSSKLWNSVKGINKLRESILFAPFKASDYISGAPMMLANIMHHEEVAGRATGWEGLTYNDDSFIRSLDETERFIGIGASSRRGTWTNNKNGWMSIARNIISAFSSHRVNNATNFAVEYARLRDENLSSEEKLKSLRYILAIGAQSATFSAVKWAMIGGFYNILTSVMGEEENEDELEKEYRKLLTGNYKPGDKKIIEAEIAMRQNVRNEFIRAKESKTRTDIVLIRGLQDVAANTFLIPAVSDMPLNMVVHAVYDQYEAERFKEVKKGEIKILEEKLKKAKASKNTNLAIQLQKDLSRWNAQEAIPLVYEQRGVTPIGGLYGGVVNEAYKFMDAAAGSFIKAEAMSLQDALLGAGLIGLSQPDINRWARMYSKVNEYEEEFAEKLQEIKEKEVKKAK